MGMGQLKGTGVRHGRIPVGVWCQNDVVSTSMQRSHLSYLFIDKRYISQERRIRKKIQQNNTKRSIKFVNSDSRTLLFTYLNLS